VTSTGTSQTQALTILRGLARAAIDDGRLTEGIELATSAFEIADPALAERRKRADLAPIVIGILELACSAIPLAVDRTSLTRFEQLIRSSRRISRLIGTPGQQLIQSASRVLDGAYRCLCAMETSRPCDRQALQSAARLPESEFTALIQGWLDFQFLREKGEAPHVTYNLVTHPDDRVFGKCFWCGAQVRAKRTAMLAPGKCPKCASPREFVLFDSE
jgi:hypothetical protein